MQLKTLHQEFVLHFGEMGSRWGINRTVGQIYALLYLAEDPLNAEQIVASLGDLSLQRIDGAQRTTSLEFGAIATSTRRSPRLF